MSQGLVSLIERGHLDRVPLRRLRRLFAVFDAEVVIVVRWRGGEIDRITDAAHAALAEQVSRELIDAGWTVQPEVSFSEYGERGSIDLLAWHARTKTLLVVEIKSEIGAVESTLRIHDMKCRLAPGLARLRFGWEVENRGRLLVLPDERTPRRHVARHASLFGRAYLLRTIDVRRWLASPSGAMSGLMFAPAPKGSGRVARKRITLDRDRPDGRH
jgi:hypothetical protein